MKERRGKKGKKNWEGHIFDINKTFSVGPRKKKKVPSGQKKGGQQQGRSKKGGKLRGPKRTSPASRKRNLFKGERGKRRGSAWQPDRKDRGGVARILKKQW